MATKTKRKTSPKPTLRGRRYTYMSRAAKANWDDPVKREAMLTKRAFTRLLRKHLYKPPSRIGVPDGMRKEEAQRLWAIAREEARKFIQIMEDAGELNKNVIPGSEEEMAKRVLEEAYMYAVGPQTDARNKATYIRVVLDFTKQKPESKNKLTLENSAEWLKALSADMPKKDADGGAQ